MWFHNSPVANTRISTLNDAESSQPELCLRHLGLSVGSDFVPPTTVPAIDTYIDLVQKDIEQLKGQDVDHFFLDKVLREFAKVARSYIQDTTDFLNRIEGITVEDNTILASFDVVSLYMLINHMRGLKAVKNTCQY